MKLLLYNDFQPGLLKGDAVIDISKEVAKVKGTSPQETVQNIITNFASLKPSLERALASSKGVPVNTVRLRAPLPRPGKIICCIGNYKEGTQRETRPLDFFLKSPDSVIGPGDTVVFPEYKATIFHHEAELAVVIGSRASNVPQAKALNYVFGYTCFMDVSARGVGRSTAGAGSFLGKSYDTFGPLGPVVVTADEIPDPHKLAIKYRVDGQIRHDYNTSDIEHPIPEVIAFASSVMTLFPGDVIALGTNHQGIGPLQNGETGEIEIQGIGKMAVKVVDPLKRTWPKGVDQATAARIRGA